MADLTLTRSWAPAVAVNRLAWLDRLAHHAEVLRRRARRNRYLAVAGRSPKGYPWFDTLFTSMSGRS